MASNARASVISQLRQQLNDAWALNEILLHDMEDLKSVIVAAGLELPYLDPAVNLGRQLSNKKSSPSHVVNLDDTTREEIDTPNHMRSVKIASTTTDASAFGLRPGTRVFRWPKNREETSQAFKLESESDTESEMELRSEPEAQPDAEFASHISLSGEGSDPQDDEIELSRSRRSAPRRVLGELDRSPPPLFSLNPPSNGKEVVIDNGGETSDYSESDHTSGPASDLAPAHDLQHVTVPRTLLRQSGDATSLSDSDDSEKRAAIGNQEAEDLPNPFRPLPSEDIFGSSPQSEYLSTISRKSPKKAVAEVPRAQSALDRLSATYGKRSQAEVELVPSRPPKQASLPALHRSAGSQSSSRPGSRPSSRRLRKAYVEIDNPSDKSFRSSAANGADVSKTPRRLTKQAFRI